ncbi:ESCO1/2 acetyl-transferase-like protein [Elsinoe fawcettii]|nr:ESCO1/2 acetyl-transferase-like protein [Elsinoe fawcettii]
MADLPKKPRVLKTYSRAHKRLRADLEDIENTKRRRIEDELPIAKPKPRPFGTVDAWLRNSRSSTPVSQLPSSDNAIFSDTPDDATTKTPPSSPPPLLPDLIDNEKEAGRHGATKVGTTLLPLSSNIQREPITATTKKPLETSLVQMQINLGANLQKTCEDCGMTYVRSDASDSALHDKYHARNLDGLCLGKAFRKWAEARAVWRGQEGRLIVAVDGADKSFERRKAREVLDIAQTELGAVDVADDNLWRTSAAGIESSRVGQYRVYLYVMGMSCVGLCLAKHITEAREVMNTTMESAGDLDEIERGLVLSESSTPAVIGISRIWVSKSHRSRGIGTALLDCVTRTFDARDPVQKTQIAFSQPTTSGTALARRWTEKQYGWLVYVE